MQSHMGRYSGKERLSYRQMIQGEDKVGERHSSRGDLINNDVFMWT